MDYYIKKSEGLEYVTPGAKKFEWGLLDHVKRIREGGDISSKNNQNKEVLSVINNKIKSNFKVNEKT